MEQHFLLALCVALLTSIISMLILKPFAHVIRLVDIPGGRKEHTHPTPVIGGIAMFIGILAGISFIPTVFHEYRSFIFTGLFILIVGVLDDLHDISPRVRLLLQMVAVGLMIFWGKVNLEHLGGLFSDQTFVLGAFAVPVTLFGATTLINAVNMLDGIDGLASSVGLISLLSLVGIAFGSGFSQAGMVLSLISCALLGFMSFNFPLWPKRKAIAFMGDAGSTLLGLSLGWFTIALSQEAESIASPAVMLWVVMIPIMDLATVFIKRIKENRSPFKPGKDHIHHALETCGLSRVTTLWVIIGLTFIGQSVAWTMIYCHVPDIWIFIIFILSFTVYLRWNLRISTQTC